MKLQDIAAQLAGTLHGDASLEVTGVASLEEAKGTDISFVLEPRFTKMASQSQARAFVTYDYLPQLSHQIVVGNARKALRQLLCLWYPTSDQHATPYRSTTARIHPSAQIHDSVCIGDFVVIEENVTIHERCIIDSHTVIQSHSKIGKNCHLFPHVTCYPNTQLGDNVRVHAGTVLGADGFGYTFEDGQYHKIPHIGAVIVENDVEIGANVTIDRGCLGNTIIGEGSKIDNLCQIGHNTRIGKHCVVVAQTGITGSSCIGNFVRVGGQVGIASTQVGDGAVVAARSGVTKAVKPGSTVSGFPAWDHRSELKLQARLRKLI